MPASSIECQQLWKKFNRGERHDSLRDAVPAVLNWLLRRHQPALQEHQFWALQDVSFTVQRGQALGIIGPNGAGKSTLLKILSSILAPDRGRVHINGRLSALIEVGAGFHPDLTGRENIYLNGAILGMTRREINGRIGEMVDFAGVGEFIDTPIKRYSSGMQARLGFSVAAHMDPDVLLVDEVLAVGDAQFQQRCLDKMNYFAHSGRSIVFISHNLQAVSELCPQAMLLMSGCNAFLGDTRQAVKAYLDLMRESAVAPARGPMSLHRVRLVDEGGRECGQFTSGARAAVQFDLGMDVDPQQYYLGFVIKRVTDRLHVCDYNLPLPPEIRAPGTYHMSIEFDANFLAGSYSVTLFLAHKPTSAKHVYLDLVKIFDVSEQEHAYAGIVHVAPQLCCRPAAAGVGA